MFKQILTLCTILFFGVVYGQKKGTFQRPITYHNGIIKCLSTEYEESLLKKNKERRTKEQFETWLAPIIEKQKQDLQNGRSPQTVFTIPVVIHIIHNGDPINTPALHDSENISYAQAVSQIEVLNQDFRRLIGTPGYGTTGYQLGVDCEVNFCLAQQDPFGLVSNGVNRVNLGQADWLTEDIESIVKPTTQWDPTRYLNLWCVKFSDEGLLGYAQFPSGSGLGGLDPDGGASNTDGVVASYTSFGTTALNDGSFNLQAGYDLGRTMTHEVGHWLGLRHIWGDDGECTGADNLTGDFVADTPDSNNPNSSCVIATNCFNANDMIENYMDYTSDGCMNTFTAGQKARMIAVMNNSINRSTLTSSTGCTQGVVYNYDAQIKNIKIAVDGCSTQIEPIVEIENKGTTTLTSIQINYSVDALPVQSFIWTGSLEANETIFVTMPSLITTNGAHIYQSTIGVINGVTDQNVLNNQKNKNFEIAPSYGFNNYEFKLQLDLYPEETSWNIKNSSGVVLYSGGNYPELNFDGEGLPPLPALIVQNWILPNNECYTFTINDSWGDGLYSFGNVQEDGYYSIKSTDGSTIVDTNDGFTEEQKIKNFSVSTLSSNELDPLFSTYVYPNPTKNLITIAIPNESNLPDYFVVKNILGQEVLKRTTTTLEDLTFDASNLTNGVYFVTLTKDTNNKTIRFIKE